MRCGLSSRHGPSPVARSTSRGEGGGLSSVGESPFGSILIEGSPLLCPARSGVRTAGIRAYRTEQERRVIAWMSLDALRVSLLQQRHVLQVRTEAHG
jgi:hypothetical protein